MDTIDSIGFVGGGQMGEALIRGILNAGLLTPRQITVLEPDNARSVYIGQLYGIRQATDPTALTSACRVIILAVKPQVITRVLALYRESITGDHLVISIAAGVPISTLEQGLGSGTRIVRVMPNTPALVLAGASALSANSSATGGDIAAARQIFSAVGMCVEVSESLLDAVTGLSGSGPGYVFTFIEALTDGGVLAGLPRNTAAKLALQTVYGAAKLAMESGDHPAVLRGRVTSPGGTTITGLQVLEESGFRGAVMTAVAEAAERSRELGR